MRFLLLHIASGESEGRVEKAALSASVRAARTRLALDARAAAATVRAMLFRSLLSAVVSLAAAGAAFAGEHWPQFRGPKGDGHSDSTGLPVRFSETERVKWKAPIHGKAWSSPIIWGSQIWLTTATEDGTQLSVVCVDKETGKVIHDRVLFRVASPQFCHKFNSYASPTPVVEEGRVYVTFGSPGTACLDTRTGETLWERTDFECNHYRGAGSSPVVWRDLVLLHFDGSDRQYVAALDKKTGKTAWQVNRSIDFKDIQPDGKPEAEGDWRKAFSTPHVYEENGRAMMISSGAKAHYAYDPATGKELWRVEERDSHSAAARPAVGHGLAFIPAGYGKAGLLAIRLDGEGARDSAAAVAWRIKKAVPNKPSATLVGDLLFTVNDGGIVSCIEARSGDVLWTERVQGNYSASPIVAEGRLYLCSEEGKVAVVAADRKFQLLAENQLADGFMASPAVSGKALFLRSKTHLYRIEE
jgi:outer membrane protein assembly factor BamB